MDTLKKIMDNKCQTINASKSGKYKKDYMKSKFNLDDDLLPNKIIKLHN